MLFFFFDKIISVCQIYNNNLRLNTHCRNILLTSSLILSVTKGICNNFIMKSLLMKVKKLTANDECPFLLYAIGFNITLKIKGCHVNYKATYKQRNKISAITLTFFDYMTHIQMFYFDSTNGE
jgi:hypothetical protein